MTKHTSQSETPTLRPPELPMCVFITGGGYIPFWFLLLLCLMVFVTIGVVFLMPSLPFASQRPIPQIMIGAIVGAFLLLSIRLCSMWTERQIRHVADAASGYSDMELAVRLGSLLWRSADRRTYRAVLQCLHARGFENRTIFFYDTHQPYWRTVPIQVPFEPTPLDEANATFNELESGLRDTEKGEWSVSRHSGNASTGLFRRRLKRRITVTGLWLAVVMLGFMLVISSIRFASTGSLSPYVFLSIVALIACIGSVLFPTWLHGPFWFLVPGGLVQRKPRRRSTESDLYVFVRSSSVLIFRPLGKHLWTMAVWDGKELGLGQVSEDEVNLLLRAWLSPLAPPAVEKLVDLT